MGESNNIAKEIIEASFQKIVTQVLGEFTPAIKETVRELLQKLVTCISGQEPEENGNVALEALAAGVTSVAIGFLVNTTQGTKTNVQQIIIEFVVGGLIAIIKDIMRQNTRAKSNN